MNKETIIKNINPIIAGIMVICYFIPMFTIDFFETTLSAFELSFGVTFVYLDDLSPYPVALLILLFPLSVVLSNFIPKLKKWKKKCLLISPIASLIFLIIVRVSYSGVSSSIGFWLYLILSICLIVSSRLGAKGIDLDQNRKGVSAGRMDMGYRDRAQDTSVMICPKCGNKITDGKKFCGKCGAEIPTSNIR